MLCNLPARRTVLSVFLLALASLPAQVTVRTMPGYPNAPRLDPNERHLCRPLTDVVLWGNTDLTAGAGYTWTWSFASNPDVIVRSNGTPVTQVTGTVTNTQFIHTIVQFELQNGRTLADVMCTLHVDNGAGSQGHRQVGVRIVDVLDPASNEPLERQGIDASIAVANGMRYLYLRQATDGSWQSQGSQYPYASTAFACWAFQNQGHFERNADEDIYAAVVKKGLEFILLSGIFDSDITAPRADVARGARADGISDMNNNNRTIILGGADGGVHGVRRGYSVGIATAAVVATNDPTHVVDLPGTHILDGLTYREIVEDAIDWMGAQQATGFGTWGGRGGWCYDPDSGSNCSDMSCNSWCYISMEGAEREMGITVPDWLKEECEWGVFGHQADSNAAGGVPFGYRDVNNGQPALIGGGLSALALARTATPPHRGQVIATRTNLNTLELCRDAALRWLGGAWNNGRTAFSWQGGNLGNLYAMWTNARGLRLTAEGMGLPLGENLKLQQGSDRFDWATGMMYDANNQPIGMSPPGSPHRGYYQHLLEDVPQLTSGAIGDQGSWVFNTQLAPMLDTAFAVLVLTPKVFFSTCPGNLPPDLTSGPPNNTVRTHVGGNGGFVLTFGPPEPVQQIARIDVESFGLANFSFDPPTLGITGQVVCHFTPSAAQVTTGGAPHVVRITAWDDCTPSLSRVIDINLEVCTCATAASVSTVGPGWPGTLGVPALTSSLPTPCLALQLQHQNALGTDGTGCLWIGVTGVMSPTPFGGMVYVDPWLGPAGVHAYVLPVAGATVAIPVPCAATILCGQVVFAQAFQLDPGASHGISATAGLRLVVGG
ncbi:MAG: hypothetical protein IPK26_30355 [Planctomycetes bacterium]|nr:hypothetical protein [Planctomycetota bacterium]